MNSVFKIFVYLVCMSLTLLLLGCSGEPSASSASSDNMPAQLPAPEVSVAQVVYQEINEWETFTGRLEAASAVELRPRVSGYIEKVSFEEGALVQKGSLLFKIDARSFQAEVNRLKAELKRAEAQIGLAKRDVKRAASLRQTNAISQEQLDNRNTQLVKAHAESESVKAALQSAQLNLSFTQVRAPITGRVSIANITEGNYVSQGESVLTTLVSMDQVYAYFDVDEQAFVQMTQLSEPDAVTQPSVFMNLVNEQGYPHQGKVDFIDNQIDISTGTIRLRATFDNAEDHFTPGMFVRLKMSVSDTYAGILVDEQAISTDLNHKYVLLLTAENKVEYRAVELGPRIGGLRLIRSGLSAKDVIVVKGLQRAQPGSTVAPTTIEMISEFNRETLQLQKRVIDSLALEEGHELGEPGLEGLSSVGDKQDSKPGRGKHST